MIEWIDMLGADPVSTDQRVITSFSATDTQCPAGCISTTKTGPLATTGWGLILLGGAALVGLGFGIKAAVV